MGRNQSIPRRVSFGAVALLFLFATIGRSATEPDASLRVWLVFNLPPVGGDTPVPPVDEIIRRWDASGIDLRPLRDKARSNQEFLRQLLGQEVIIEHIAKFRSERPAFPRNRASLLRLG